MDTVESLNWLNAINGKEKEFRKLLTKIRKLKSQFLKEMTDVEKEAQSSIDASKMYNFACAFAVAGNKNMAIKYLKAADKLDPSESYLKLSKSDADFLNIKK